MKLLEIRTEGKPYTIRYGISLFRYENRIDEIRKNSPTGISGVYLIWRGKSFFRFRWNRPDGLRPVFSFTPAKKYHASTDYET